MNGITETVTLLAAMLTPMQAPPAPHASWCTPGYTVMIPDGREGFVSSVDGDICRVITDGEAFVTPLPDYIVEPVYPQKYAVRAYR